MKASETAPVRIGIGIFGYVFHDALPDPAVKLIDHLRATRAGDQQDIDLAAEMGFPYLQEQDLKGEYYPGEAINILGKAGLTLDYLGHKVNSEADIERINDRLDAGDNDTSSN